MKRRTQKSVVRYVLTSEGKRDATIFDKEVAYLMFGLLVHDVKNGLCKPIFLWKEKDGERTLLQKVE